jgi:hypothetical protein
VISDRSTEGAAAKLEVCIAGVFQLAGVEAECERVIVVK